MVNHTGWYPPGQICYPPKLPTYLKNVYDLKPIVGVPSDTEVIGIHAVIQAANKVSGVPGMHDPSVFMGLSDHLFAAQMAKYRSKYSLVVFPADATYTPPTVALPAHISVNLAPVYGAPSDEEIVKVQEAVRLYQQFSQVPALFDGQVNMELSQHLFDLQMARYMRCAGESQTNFGLQTTAEMESSAVTAEQRPRMTEEAITATNNVGSGANAAITHASPPISGTDVGEVMERSNQLSKHLAALLERSNELAEKSTQPTEQTGPTAERFNQVLERLTRLAENTRSTTGTPDPHTELFTQLLERIDRMVEQCDRSAQQTNQHAERSNQHSERSNRLIEQLSQKLQQSNQLAEGFSQLFGSLNQLISGFTQPTQQSNRLEGCLNQLMEGLTRYLQRSNELSAKANGAAEQLNQLTERSNQLMEQASKPAERLESVMKDTNKVLAGIQHAIVRNYRGNTIHAVDCLVNEKGDTLASSLGARGETVESLSNSGVLIFDHSVTIGGVPKTLSFPDEWLPELLCFYGIWEGVCETDTDYGLIEGQEEEARKRLSGYLSSCLG